MSGVGCCLGTGGVEDGPENTFDGSRLPDHVCYVPKSGAVSSTLLRWRVSLRLITTSFTTLIVVDFPAWIGEVSWHNRLQRRTSPKRVCIALGTARGVRTLRSQPGRNYTNDTQTSLSSYRLCWLGSHIHGLQPRGGGGGAVPHSCPHLRAGRFIQPTNKCVDLPHRRCFSRQPQFRVSSADLSTSRL